jgi:hypothetical protein
MVTGLPKYYPDVYPGTVIPNPDFFPSRSRIHGSRIPDLGSRIHGSRIPDLGSRIRIGHTELTMNLFVLLSDFKYNF